MCKVLTDLVSRVRASALGVNPTRAEAKATKVAAADAKDSGLWMDYAWQNLEVGN